MAGDRGFSGAGVAWRAARAWARPRRPMVLVSLLSLQEGGETMSRSWEFFILPIMSRGCDSEVLGELQHPVICSEDLLSGI